MSKENKNNPNKKLKAAELSVFCMQTALVLKSGMLVSEGISWMYDDAPKGSVKVALGFLKDELDKQITLFNAMENSGYFPTYVVKMCEIGETTGKLEDVMRSLSEYYDREEYIKAKIKNAVFYPATLFVMMSFVIILLVVKIFPIFEGMLTELGGELSNEASALMSFSTGIMAGKFTMWFVIALIATLGCMIIFVRTKPGKIFFDKFLADFIVTKSITSKVTAARFSSSMSLLLSSGMNIEESIDMSLDIVENSLLRDKINLCNSRMKSGESFIQAISKIDIFASMHIQMLNIGQRTGEIDTVMKKLSNIYENESDAAISTAVSFIEPVLVGVLSLVIGVVLISVMLPLMGIMSSIG